MAKLEKTIDGMLSEDYKERLKAEYHQVLYRKNKLQKVVSQYDKGELEIKLAVPIDILKEQLDLMKKYVKILKERAAIEHIDLKL